MVICLPTRIRTRQNRGYALLLVMVLTAVTMFALATALNWSSGQSILDERKGRFYRSEAAAAAAVAKVVGTIVRDYQEDGPATVSAKLDNYRSLVPTAKENAAWADYTFSDNHGQTDRVYVRQLTSWGAGTIQALPGGAVGQRASYSVEVQATERTQHNATAAAIQQEVEIASVPLFRFAIFYDLDLEMNAPEHMTVAGRVHSNGNMYSQPEGRLQFSGPVTASGSIQTVKHPQDPVIRDTERVTFDEQRVERATSLSLAIDARTDTRGLHRILEEPSSSELARSDFAQKSFFNRADLIVLFTDSGTRCFSGSYNKFSTTVSWSLVKPFADETSVMYDWREGRYVNITELDLDELEDQQKSLEKVLGRRVSVLYVADYRSPSSGRFNALRVIKGGNLPASGFTLATPNPLYVKGDFNTGNPKVKASLRKPVPACLAADAITILSKNWDDSDSWRSLHYRNATDTTINAAILTGITPTRAGYYSGGVENALRLLEDWSNDDLDFKGAIAVLFASQTARSPWGASPYVYTTPKRNWDFNAGFGTVLALPPGTPELMIVSPGKPKSITALRKK